MILTVAALICVVALWMWRPVVEIYEASQRLREWQAEQALQAPWFQPPPYRPRPPDDDDQGYVY